MDWLTCVLSRRAFGRTYLKNIDLGESETLESQTSSGCSLVHVVARVLCSYQGHRHYSNEGHPTRLMEQLISLTGIIEHDRSPPGPSESLRVVPEFMFFPYPLRNGQTKIQWCSEYLAPSSDEAKFLAFLSLYGSNGVQLIDLMLFARLRVSRKPSENHWLLNGEVGPILRPVGDTSLPTDCSFLIAFVRAISDYQCLEDLQNRLLHLDLIQVEYPSRRSFPTEHAWLNDERIWRVAKNPMSSHLMVPTWHGQDGEGIIMDLLYVFLEMPSKDVSLLAERHRETFYIHARIFAIQISRFCQTILKNAIDYVVALILEILTHRSQNGDNGLIQLAKACPSSANGFDWAIMVFLVELKAINSSGGLRLETALNNRITALLSQKGKRQRRANGFIGYLLVEWRKAAEAAQIGKLESRIEQYAADWAETAWSSGSSIECAALCCVLANFQMIDKGLLVPSKYRLLYGYHLSRAGHLEQARDCLASALHSHTASELSTRLLGYRFELVSVLIRLGDQRKAEESLQIIGADVIIFYLSVGGERFVSWDRLYEHTEVGILSNLYRIELLMAMGEVSLAVSGLEYSITTARREDHYVRSLRLALAMRLLEARTWDVAFDSALSVAELLLTEFRANPSLKPDIIQWIMQQLLILSNRLLCAGNVSATSSLLDDIIRTFRSWSYSDPLKDLFQYVEQRRATVSILLSTGYAENNPAALGYKTKAAANDSLEVIDSPNNEYISHPKDLPTASVDKIARAPRNHIGLAAISELTNDEPSSCPLHDIMSNTRSLMNKRGPTEEPKPSDPTTNQLTEKASLMKLTASNQVSRSGSFTKRMVPEGLRRSVAAMLRRAPRVPTAELSFPVVESREKGPAPIPVPVVAELPRLAPEPTEA